MATPRNRLYRPRSGDENARDATTFTAAEIADAAATWRSDAGGTAKRWLDAPKAAKASADAQTINQGEP